MHKNRITKLTLLSVLAGTLAFGGTALAGPGMGGGPCGRSGPGMGGGGGMKMLRLLGQLDLTEAQEVALVRIRRELREDRQAHRAEARADRKAALAELGKPSPDRAVLQGIMDKRQARRAAMSSKVLDRVLAFHETLTPEQRRTLVEEIDRIEARMDERGERRGRRGR